MTKSKGLKVKIDQPSFARQFVPQALNSRPRARRLSAKLRQSKNLAYEPAAVRSKLVCKVACQAVVKGEKWKPTTPNNKKSRAFYKGASSTSHNYKTITTATKTSTTTSRSAIICYDLL